MSKKIFKWLGINNVMISFLDILRWWITWPVRLGMGLWVLFVAFLIGVESVYIQVGLLQSAIKWNNWERFLTSSLCIWFGVGFGMVLGIVAYKLLRRFYAGF